MTSTDFIVACNKFFYFSMNYRSKVFTLPNGDTKVYPEFMEAFDASLLEHLGNRFNSLYDSKGCYGVIFAFYADLDGKNRAKMLNWISENFKQSDTFGISLE